MGQQQVRPIVPHMRKRDWRDNHQRRSFATGATGALPQCPNSLISAYSGSDTVMVLKLKPLMVRPWIYSKYRQQHTHEENEMRFWQQHGTLELRPEKVVSNE
nr:MAG TPA: hypothetical protein [Caudoviricetes sp.]